MARERKDPSDLSIEDKLKNLYQLQSMLSEIDKIKTLRGELPLEVQDIDIDEAVKQIHKYQVNKERASVKH